MNKSNNYTSVYFYPKELNGIVVVALCDKYLSLNFFLLFTCIQKQEDVLKYEWIEFNKGFNSDENENIIYFQDKNKLIISFLKELFRLNKIEVLVMCSSLWNYS